MTDSPPGHPQIERLVAPNPGPMTLEGTNTYVVGIPGAGAYVIDPGPAAAEHVAAIDAAGRRHGGLAGILLTHSHADHSAAAPLLDVPLLWGAVSDDDEAAALGGSAPRDPERRRTPNGPAGPFELVRTPGHAPDHVCFLLGGVCFCGDLILGRGSTFVPPDGGSLSAYLDSLRAIRDLAPELLCPGHGPYVDDPVAKVEEYIGHRLDRERRLLDALAGGERSRAALLDRAWSDVPAELRPAAAVVMQAHLEKLEAEGRLRTSELID